MRTALGRLLIGSVVGMWACSSQPGEQAPASRASALTQGTSQDAWIDATSVAANHGSTKVLRVRSSGPVRRALVQFDLSAVSSCASVGSADLQLTATNGASRSYVARRVTASWTEGTGGKASGVTWNTRDGSTAWATPGGTADAVGAPGTIKGSVVHFDVTASVKDAANGWLVEDAAEGSGDVETTFASKENTTSAERPKLVITCATADAGTPPPVDLSTPPPDLGSAGGTTSTSCGTTPPLVQGMGTQTVPSEGKPAKGVHMLEPTFHTCRTRVTDHAADGLQGFARNDYSRREPFNADNSYFLAYALDGSWFLYDANTLKPLRNLTALGGDAEPQWHPTDPNTLYFVPTNGGMQLLALDVRTNTSRVVADFTGKLPWSNAAHVWTRSEGSPSRDARWWGFQVEDASFNILGFIVWDLQSNALVGSMASTNRPDHVSMSPSGRWIDISWDAPTGTFAYSPDFKTSKKLHTSSEHSDLAIGANGHDYYVSIDYSSDLGNIFMVDIDTGTRTDLPPTYLSGAASAMHFSGKAFAKPGWVVVSAYDDSGPWQWYMRKVFVMELAPNPRIYELAFHHSAVSGQYWAEPHAAVNRDFTKILFNSNWDQSGSQDVDIYQIELPANAF